MEQGSNIIEKEATEEMMNVQEVARMTEALKAFGLSDSQIITVTNYIATGVGLPKKEPAEKEST